MNCKVYTFSNLKVVLTVEIDVDAEFNRGNQYFVMHYDDVVILKIGICHSDCRRSNEY